MRIRGYDLEKIGNLWVKRKNGNVERDSQVSRQSATRSAYSASRSCAGEEPVVRRRGCMYPRQTTSTGT